ncbi:MAG TPA: glutamine synthetase, partial [Burkholderiales bacterium]|nr:glutamine synthetase [Burkholderiales bacterium]
MTFVEKHGLWDAAQQAAARNVVKEVKSHGLEVVRFSFPDLHGVLRGKSIAAAEVGAALENGVGFPSSLLAKDTSNKTVFPVFTPGAGLGLRGMEGAGDAIMVAEPRSFRVLPWAPGTAWMLCDVYFADGKPAP